MIFRASEVLFGKPSTVISPSYFRKPMIDLMIVLLPAPFGPRRTVRDPGSSVKETSLHAAFFPYILVTRLTTNIYTLPTSRLDSRCSLFPYFTENGLSGVFFISLPAAFHNSILNNMVQAIAKK